MKHVALTTACTQTYTHTNTPTAHDKLGFPCLPQYFPSISPIRGPVCVTVCVCVSECSRACISVTLGKNIGGPVVWGRLCQPCLSAPCACWCARVWRVCSCLIAEQVSQIEWIWVRVCVRGWREKTVSLFCFHSFGQEGWVKDGEGEGALERGSGLVN